MFDTFRVKKYEVLLHSRYALAYLVSTTWNCIINTKRYRGFGGGDEC